MLKKTSFLKMFMLFLTEAEVVGDFGVFHVFSLISL